MYPNTVPAKQEPRTPPRNKEDRLKADEEDEDLNATPIATRINTRSSSPDKEKSRIESAPQIQHHSPPLGPTNKIDPDNTDDSPNEYHDATPMDDTPTKAAPNQQVEDDNTPVKPEAQGEVRGGGERAPRSDDDGDDIHEHDDNDDGASFVTSKQTPPQRTSSKRSTSGMVIDYLTHPGSSGPGSRRNRVNAEEFGRILQQSKNDGKGDEPWDVECLRSPYSVD
jgi:hypothetical protein